MNNLIAIENLESVFKKKSLPTVTLWNRLEARPRANDFDRALKAEVRDALWMLTKQWQMGEFRGDDAGSPAFAKVQMSATKITKYQAKENIVQDYNNDLPLEAMVEQKKIQFRQGGQKASIDIRLLMGRQWIKMIKSSFPYKDYINRFTFAIPNPNVESDAFIIAHLEAWQYIDAIAEKSMDGFAFYEYLNDNDPTHTAASILSGLTPDETESVNKLEAKFKTWYERLFLQPNDDKNNAWESSKMEYNFNVSAPENNGEKVLVVDEYYHGHLDWYNMDIAPKKKTLPLLGPPKILENTEECATRKTYSFFPTPLSFDGMPDTRWWRFEDGNVNFCDIKPDTQDVNKLMFMEFGLVYANDWFIVPFTLPAGSIASVKGLSVTNVFGEKTWVEAAGKGDDESWNRWNMFSLNIKGKQNTPADTSLLILPTVEKIQEGRPLEEVVFIRDEVANMVWAIEKKIPLPTGSTKNGAEGANELKSFYQRILDNKNEVDGLPPPDLTLQENEAKIRFEIMNTVPENWIPFIAVRVEGTARRIRLQRASMPRILENDTAGNSKKIKPRTQLLREGLDDLIVEPYFINEEEIPQAGINVYQTYQRARWYDGKVVTWFGARKQTGRGEGHSGLAFDQIREKE